MTEEKNESSWLIDWHINLENAHKKLDEQYPFPAGLDREKAEASTEFFARSRVRFPQENKDNETHPDFNPILPYYVKTYPLPIGWEAILEAYTRNGWGADPHEIMPSPLVERPDAYAGLAIFRDTNKAKGWFIGLVKVTSAFTIPEEDYKKLSDEEQWILLYSTSFEFIEGMFLVEGKLDDDLFTQLKEVERWYNEKILGKVMRGRPIKSGLYSKDQFLSLNVSALKKFSRRPLQDEMAEQMQIDPRTYKNYRLRCGFDSYDTLIQYLYTQI
jgi:hypothetical protein